MLRNTGRLFDGRDELLIVLLRHLNAFFDFSNTSKILVHLALIGSPQRAHEFLRARVDHVQYAFAKQGAAGPCFRVGAEVFRAKQSFEGKPWVGLRGIRRRRGAPRNAVGVGAAITGIAVADGSRILAAEFERRQPHAGIELPRGDLID